MTQPSFPLFKPAPEPRREDMVLGVFDVVRREVLRASLDGPDPDAVERVRFSLDLDAGVEQHLQALATAMGSSRRSMAAKLLTGAIFETMNTLHRAGENQPEMQAVWEEYCDALEALRTDAAA